MKSLPIYPFLAALVPVFLYYNTQATQEIPLDGLLVPGGVALAATVVFYGLPCLILHLLSKKGNAETGSIDLVSLWALWTAMTWLIVFSPTFFIEANGLCTSFNLPFDPLSVAPTMMPLFWLLLFGIGLAPLVRRTLLSPVTSIMHNAFVLLFLLQLASSCWFLIRSDLLIKPAVEAIQTEEVLEPAAKSATTADAQVKPDIYYIILDEMASSGVLSKYLNYDDLWFRNELEKRGFYVTTKSLSNYPLTRLSISSSLNMMYLDRFAKISGNNNADLTVTAVLMRNSALAKLLQRNGYTYIHVDSAVPPSDNSYIADKVLHFGLVNQFSDKFFRSTIASLSPPVVSWLSDQSRERIRWQFHITGELAAQDHSKPQFVFTHILCPHEPFLFDAQGNPVFNGGERDGSRWTADTSKAYVEQSKFAQKATIETIDAIIDGSRKRGRTPLIVVQGDHGTHCSDYVSSPHPSDALLHERFGILNAYLVPENMKSELNEGTEPVNTFRIVLRKLFGSDLPDVPEKQYYATYSRVFDFKDVTETVREGTPIVEIDPLKGPGSESSSEPASQPKD